MIKSKPADLKPSENLVVVLGGIAFGVLFFGGGIVGGMVSPSTDLDSLIGLFVGALLWVLAFGTITYVLAPGAEPLETSPFDEDQPDENES